MATTMIPILLRIISNRVRPSLDPQSFIIAFLSPVRLKYKAIDKIARMTPIVIVIVETNSIFI